MVWAHLNIEEYEDGEWDELLPQLGFPLCLLHRGNYEIWSAPDGLVDVDAAFECAIRFLAESADRLRAIKERLHNPMRLAFRYKRPLYVDRQFVACETTIPAELIRLAGELGMCVEVEPYFDVRRSKEKNIAEPEVAPDCGGIS